MKIAQKKSPTTLLLIFQGVVFFLNACASGSGIDVETGEAGSISNPTATGGQISTIDLTSTADAQFPSDETSQPDSETDGPISTTATSIVAMPDPNNPLPPTPTSVSLINPDSIYPEGEILIYRPGDLSKVTSPFRLVANLEPGPNGRVHVELFGEDGRTLSRKILNVMIPASMTRFNVLTDLDFEIVGVAEAARLQVSVDDEFGRLRALASIDLILISVGPTELTRYRDTLENIIIQQPFANVMIQGETLLITGLARTDSEQPLAVELIDRDGNIVSYGMATVVFQEGEEYAFFAAEITYNVDEPTWVLITVRELGFNIPGTVHLSSVEIVLSP
ncbi:MAG: hypothetical protein FVQ83_07570 [Chloroflexi bacterium]|nr:hypothetical protein [Chloroflexota bacterium]